MKQLRQIPMVELWYIVCMFLINACSMRVIVISCVSAVSFANGPITLTAASGSFFTVGIFEKVRTIRAHCGNANSELHVCVYIPLMHSLRVNSVVHLQAPVHSPSVYLTYVNKGKCTEMLASSLFLHPQPASIVVRVCTNQYGFVLGSGRVRALAKTEQ